MPGPLDKPSQLEMEVSTTLDAYTLEGSADHAQMMGTYERSRAHDAITIDGSPVYVMSNLDYYLFRGPSGEWMVTDDENNLASGAFLLRTTRPADFPNEGGLAWQYANVCGTMVDTQAVSCTGWQQRVDEFTGGTCFYDNTTGRSMWKRERGRTHEMIFLPPGWSVVADQHGHHEWHYVNAESGELLETLPENSAVESRKVALGTRDDEQLAHAAAALEEQANASRIEQEEKDVAAALRESELEEQVRRQLSGTERMEVDAVLCASKLEAEKEAASELLLAEKEAAALAAARALSLSNERDDLEFTLKKEESLRAAGEEALQELRERGQAALRASDAEVQQLVVCLEELDTRSRRQIDALRDANRVAMERNRELGDQVVQLHEQLGALKKANAASEAELADSKRREQALAQANVASATALRDVERSMRHQMDQCRRENEGKIEEQEKKIAALEEQLNKTTTTKSKSVLPGFFSGSARTSVAPEPSGSLDSESKQLFDATDIDMDRIVAAQSSLKSTALASSASPPVTDCVSKTVSKTRTSKYPHGIAWDAEGFTFGLEAENRPKGAWSASIEVPAPQGIRNVFIGFFDDEQEAAEAYDSQARELGLPTNLGETWKLMQMEKDDEEGSDAG